MAVAERRYALRDLPHLASPAHLMLADNPTYTVPPHIKRINHELTVMSGNPEGGARNILNLPYQHGKSVIASHYYPAWKLLLYPQTRFVLVGHGDEFAAEFGLKVRDTIRKYGADVGVRLRRDSKARGQWRVSGHEGGMVCRGWKGGVVGRPADEFMIDDLIKSPEQAMSPTVLDGHWNFYETVVFGRLRRRTNLTLIGTRWSRRDIFGRILSSAKKTGETWNVLKFKAIAEADDPLGRKPGTPLWPEQVPLSHLLIAQARNPWWKAAWQQEPEDEKGSWFDPHSWPAYEDTGDAYSLALPGLTRTIFLHSECTRIVTCDWAWGQKKTSDFSAIGVFALTPQGQLLILEVVNRRFRVSDLAGGIADVCRRWRPHYVAIETGHPTVRDDLNAYAEVPEPRWLTTESKDKRLRAFTAINMGANGKIFLPATKQPWQDEFCSQLIEFTGIDDEHDDEVDALAYGAKLAQELKPTPRSRLESWPDLLVAGKSYW